MTTKRKWICRGVVGAFLVWGWWFISKEPYPTDTWDTPEKVFGAPSAFYFAADEHNILSNTLLEEIDFKVVLLRDAAESLIAQINSKLPVQSQFSLEFVGDDFNDKPFDLQLKKVPAVEALRYVTALGYARYDLHKGFKVQILPLSYTPDKGEVYEVDYRFSFSEPRIHQAKAPVDVTKELEAYSRNLEWAKYYPDELRLRIRGTRDQIYDAEGFVDSLHWGRYALYSIKDRWYYQALDWLVQKRNPPIPVIIPAPSSPPAPSPFEPDPFGGGGVPAAPAGDVADPFRAR